MYPGTPVRKTNTTHAIRSGLERANARALRQAAAASNDERPTIIVNAGHEFLRMEAAADA